MLRASVTLRRVMSAAIPLALAGLVYLGCSPVRDRFANEGGLAETRTSAPSGSVSAAKGPDNPSVVEAAGAITDEQLRAILELPAATCSLASEQVEESVLKFLRVILKPAYLPEADGNDRWTAYVNPGTRVAPDVAPRIFWLDYARGGMHMRVGLRPGILEIIIVRPEAEGNASAADSIEESVALLDSVLLPSCSPKGRTLHSTPRADAPIRDRFRYGAEAPGIKAGPYVWICHRVVKLDFLLDVHVWMSTGTGRRSKSSSRPTAGRQASGGRDGDAARAERPTRTGEQTQDDGPEEARHVILFRRAIADARRRRRPIPAAELIRALEASPKGRLWDDALFLALVSIRENENVETVKQALDLAEDTSGIEPEKWTIANWPEYPRYAKVMEEFVTGPEGRKDFAVWCVLEEMAERATRLRDTGDLAGEIDQLEELVLGKAREIAEAWPRTEMGRRCRKLVAKIASRRGGH